MSAKGFVNEEERDIYRHSTAHIMAQAVKELYPKVKLAIGPSIEEGFYYDFDLDRSFTPDDLQAIEKRMRDIIERDLEFRREEVSREQALKLFGERGEKYKVELLEELTDVPVSIYYQGDFFDLCRGPHVSRTGEIKAFKLLSVAGAYWRGNEKREMLQRIYGTAFKTQKELDEHIFKLEEASRRDHRKLGKELDLFSINETAGAGFIYYHPKGALVRTLIEDFEKREHARRGYQMVITPHIAREELWQISGHAGYYRENMYYLNVDEQEYVLKPMNCPGHILIYKTQTRSYRDMPLRYFEMGTVYRYERSGVLHGLLRVRGFTQDDSHIFCIPEQLESEIAGVVDFAFFMLKRFGFSDVELFLSTRPEKYVGSDENWERATDALRNALKAKELPYRVDPGEGVFYGPKIDFKLRDALGRLWQGPTVQVDFNLPERFDISYIGADGQEHRPIMIHRVVLGSMERFFGTLIEHYGGAFPLWLAPVQVRLLPIADRHFDYADAVCTRLREADFRAEVDKRNEKTGFKIRQAQSEKIPYMVVIGDREAENSTLSLRHREKGDMGTAAPDDFIAMLREEASR
ncbi:MAG: threonine--tRNA ligase [bacterium]|jgi:threonyl-tRNA synthetase|nr:threonine--tRNA ligase [bacterium]MDD4557359.1 threonine--tRNA ligase [bacterium]